VLLPRQRFKLARDANDKERAKSQTPKTVGIDIGKNTFDVVGHDEPWRDRAVTIVAYGFTDNGVLVMNPRDQDRSRRRDRDVWRYGRYCREAVQEAYTEMETRRVRIVRAKSHGQCAAFLGRSILAKDAENL
jgi:hypothetical protein